MSGLPVTQKPKEQKRPSSQYMTATMSSTHTTSPPPLSLKTFRFSSQPDIPQLQRSKTTTSSKNLDVLSRNHRASMQLNARSDKSKDIAKGKTSVDSTDTASSAGAEVESFAAHYNASSSFTSNEQSPTPSRESPLLTDHSQSNANSTTIKKRGSLLVAASDALNFKFGRRRKSIIRQPQIPIVLPEVIEISAPRRDEEVEERERLRDAAVHSIGLAPVLVPESQATEDNVEAEDQEVNAIEEEEWEEVQSLEHLKTAGSTPSPQTLSNRQGSWITPSPSNRLDSVTIPTVPAFPCTPSSLNAYIQMASTIPKFYPPTSLRIFSLSRNWKNRFMILTSPPPIPKASVGPVASHLHLFRSSGQAEEELERLEINEDSIVFVAEEEEGGRRNVVKVGGGDVGSMNKLLNPQSGGRTMWFLQIASQTEAQKWIAAIKNAILGQRSMRAGLGLPAHTLGSIEPRGDMDVMLSMRAQGIISSPVSGKFIPPETNLSRPLSGSSASPRENYAASVSSRSVRSQSTFPRISSTGTMSTLKGLFSNNRPRSTSRAASLNQDGREREYPDDAFGNRGNTLLSLLQSGEGGSSSPPPVPPLPSAFVTPSENGAALQSPIDRRILEEPHAKDWPPPESDVKTSNDRFYKTQSVSQPIVTPSLQPPPRKRWTYTLAPPPLSTNTGMYQHTNGNASMANSFGIAPSSDASTSQPQRPASPASTAHSPGSPEQSNRAPSLYSVSTFASAENTTADRPIKRWSRQGNLPQILAPPSVPPPSTPPPAPPQPSPILSQPHSPTSSQSRSSSIISATSPNSTPTGLPFSKRTSDSSRFSDSTASTSQSPATGSPHTSISYPVSTLSSSLHSSTHRLSAPPPQRPAPNFAPPPPPDQDVSLSRAATPLRDSVVHPNRVLRMSLMGPKPPPSTALPARPDEEFRPSHRRTSSGSITNVFSTAGPSGPPFPPPNTPLPPPPSPSSSSFSRRSSLKQRLRILSAPSPSSTFTASSNHSTRPMTPTNSPTPPATPVGVKTNTQPDPSFLLIYSPSTPTASFTPTLSSIKAPLRRQDPDPDRPPPPESQSSSPEIASLSPPPRRGSRVLSLQVTESSDETPIQDEQPPFVAGERNLSLSPRTSAVSLGIAI